VPPAGTEISTLSASVGRRLLVIGAAMSETCPRAGRADQYRRFAKSDDDTSFLGRRASRDFNTLCERR
jgi:hypothetical protein